MKTIVLLALFLGSSLLHAGSTGEEKLFGRAQLTLSEHISQGQQNQLRYTLSRPMVREAFEQTDYVISNIVAVPADMEFANHVVGNTLFLSPGVSPLLVSEILSGPQHFLSADYLIDQRNQEIENLTREMLEEVEQAESKDDVYDALVFYYDQLPTNSQKIDLNEYREKVAIVLADQSLSTIKSTLTSAGSKMAKKFMLFFPLMKMTAYEMVRKGNPYPALLTPFFLALDAVLLPFAILLLPFTLAM